MAWNVIRIGSRDTLARIRGVPFISPTKVPEHFGGCNERIDTDLVQSRWKKEEQHSNSHGHADGTEYPDV